MAESGEWFSCHLGVDDREAPDCVDWNFRADGVAVKPDGSPADLCAGWWAYRRREVRDV
jgi:hypothetical protein